MQTLHGGKTLVSSQVITLQKKAWGIISNQPRNNHSGPIFKKIISLNLVIYIINYLSLPIKLTLME